MQTAFGSGSLWGIPSAANPTPSRMGALQDVGIEFTSTIKELYGSYQFPLAVGRGTGKIQGKAKYSQLHPRAFNDLYFGGSMASGQTLVADNESGTIATGAVTVANGATFSADLGVVDATTGLPFVRVASAPAVGQYSGPSGSGVYTFNVTDNGKAVKISYAYTAASTGQTMTMSNQLLGAASTFKSVYTAIQAGQRTTLTLNACMANKVSIDPKLEDFAENNFEFSAFADAAQNLGTWSFAEQW